MADLEQRVARLEREMKAVPEMVDLQARINASLFASLFSELDTLKRTLEALPRVVAEMLSKDDEEG